MGTLTCPQCGESRIGNFRFCRACAFDFDTLPVVVPVPVVAEAVSRPWQRRTMPSIPVGRVMLFVALAALGIGAIALLTKPVPSGSVAGETSVPIVPAPGGSPEASISAGPTPLSLGVSLSGPVGAVTRGKVVKVVDGDSILVDLDGATGIVRIRYLGIDAPKRNDGDLAHAWVDDLATRANAKLVSGRTVLLERDVTDRDRDGRFVRDVWTDRGRALVLVNLELVRSGFAQRRPAAPDVRYDFYLAAAQADASTAHLGMWAAGPTPSPS